MLLTSKNIPHITLGIEQRLKLLMGVCNTKKKIYFYLSLVVLEVCIQQ
jgi:hypothetical protein